MKRLIAIILLAVMLAGCTTRTEYGPCVGMSERSKDPALTYKLSVWNLVLAVVFFQTIFTPIVVIIDNAYCPDGKK